MGDTFREVRLEDATRPGPAPEDGVSGVHIHAEQAARSALSAEFGYVSLLQLANRVSPGAPEIWYPEIVKWPEEKRIFSVNLLGVAEVFPTFQFTDDGQPLPVIEAVIRALGEPLGDTWALALWFTTPSATLDGRRPVDLLETDPAAVIARAEAFADDLRSDR